MHLRTLLHLAAGATLGIALAVAPSVPVHPVAPPEGRGAASSIDAAAAATPPAGAQDGAPSTDGALAASSAPLNLPPGSPYVALGDSYAAGYGLGHPTRRPVPACGQSKLDYPHRLAAALHLDLTDVTCAGATTADVVAKRQNGAPPQITALGAGTALVTLTVGGNDAGLFSQAFDCLALSPKGPVISGRDAPSCRSRLVHDGTDALAAKVAGPVSNGIVKTIRAVQRAAPNARIVLVGYPAIFPNQKDIPKGGCFRSALDFGALAGFFPSNSFPFTTTDVAYLHNVQALLDQVSSEAARATGITYVSTFGASEHRSACDKHGALVSGVTLRSSGNFRRIQIVPGSLHPTTAGAAFMASKVAAALRSPTTAPSAPSGSHAASSPGSA
ncbi:SGNH/GDSL hydrolase family protein [Curtobacterium ammoniigenes]|uniref:SGNH/GDSL hydrolase family protein n=1 Tax=Curtobacterium ammoniigenes TaxID=395387 RepID=UPI00082E86A9|nr:SGNH/GDSL hydrolase family protein [Curtobacterium ammoniigenes]